MASHEENTRRESVGRERIAFGPHLHITIEADDYPTLTKALGPHIGRGTGHVSPVLTLDQAFPMAETGAFRASN